MSTVDYYKVLDVSPNATEDEIRQVFSFSPLSFFLYLLLYLLIYLFFLSVFFIPRCLSVFFVLPIDDIDIVSKFLLSVSHFFVFIN